MLHLPYSEIPRKYAPNFHNLFFYDYLFADVEAYTDVEVKVYGFVAVDCADVRVVVKPITGARLHVYSEEIIDAELNADSSINRPLQWLYIDILCFGGLCDVFNDVSFLDLSGDAFLQLGAGRGVNVNEIPC